MKKNFYETGYAKMDSIVDRHRLVLTIQYLAQGVKKSKSLKILDVGCWDGLFAHKIGETLKTEKLFGVDISKSAVKIANKSGVKSEVVDINHEKLPYPDKYFDVVFCGSMLEIAGNPDFLISEIHRVTKKNGRAIYTVPNLCSWANRLLMFFGELPFYYRVSTEYQFPPLRRQFASKSSGIIRLFNLKTLHSLLELHGFKVLESFGAKESAVPFPLSLIDSIISKITALAFQMVIVTKPK